MPRDTVESLQAELADKSAENARLRALIVRMRSSIATLLAVSDDCIASVGLDASFLANENLIAILASHVNELEISVRARNIFRKEKITHIIQIVEKTDVQMLQLKGFGRKLLNDIQEQVLELSREEELPVKVELGMKISILLRQEVSLRIANGCHYTCPARI